MRILQGHVLDMLKTLDAESVHCCVTSPPYWGLRAYGTEPQNWGNWRGELGSEPTPEMYVSHMVEIFDEVRRVLRKDGTCWLNISDSYAANRSYQVKDSKHVNVGNNGRSSVPDGLKPKDMCLIPQRLVIALQDAGWWVRSDIVWSKPNPLPESVRDRPSRSHEYIFLLTKTRRYWYDADAIRRKARIGDLTNPSYRKRGKSDSRKKHVNISGIKCAPKNNGFFQAETANARSVWTFATGSFKDAHFATFPQELVRRSVLAGCPEKVCRYCGKGWVREVESKAGVSKDCPKTQMSREARGQKGATGTVGQSGSGRVDGYRKTLGFSPTCSCNAPHDGNPCHHCGTEGFRASVEPCYSPGIVLDPFLGSGTTGLVALQLNRECIGIELNPEYAEMAEKRIYNDAPLLNGVEVI